MKRPHIIALKHILFQGSHKDNDRIRPFSDLPRDIHAIERICPMLLIQRNIQ